MSYKKLSDELELMSFEDSIEEFKSVNDRHSSRKPGREHLAKFSWVIGSLEVYLQYDDTSAYVLLSEDEGEIYIYDVLNLDEFEIVLGKICMAFYE